MKIFKNTIFILILLNPIIGNSANCSNNHPIDSIYNVKEFPYNAVGNGITDDTSSIQCAIDDAVSNSGGVIYLPIGTYAHQGLRLYGSAIKLTGAVETGALVHGTKLLYTKIGGSQLYIGGESSKQIHVENLTLLAKFDQPSGVFIHAEGTQNYTNGKLYFENIEIHAASNLPIYGSGYNGILLDGLNTVTINKIRITGLTGKYAIKLAGSKRHSDVFRLSNILYNSLIDGGSYITDGLVIEDGVSSVKTFAVDMLHARIGFVVGSNNPNRLDPHYIYLLDVTSEFSRIYGIYSRNHEHYFEIKNCYIHVNGIHGINILPGSGPTHISGCTIQRNGVHNPLGSGIWLNAAKGGSIIGNFIADNGNAGIYIAPSTDGYVITGNNSVNTTTNMQNYGILVNSGTRNSIITNNILKNNVTSNIKIGAITNTIVKNNVSAN